MRAWVIREGLSRTFYRGRGRGIWLVASGKSARVEKGGGSRWQPVVAKTPGNIRRVSTNNHGTRA